MHTLSLASAPRLLGASGATPEKAQEMLVEIEYQTFQGFPIPAKLTMSVVNTGIFNFVLDGCTVNAASK